MESNKPVTRIPKNPQPDFEIIQGFTGKDLLFVSPSFIIDAAVIYYTPDLTVGLLVSGAITVGWAALRKVTPARDDVPLWKHISWWMRYTRGQKEFRYRKEITYVEDIQSKKKTKEIETIRTVSSESHEC